MNKTMITLLALGLVAVSAPLAVADEGHADCEPGQKWIGYKTSDDVRTLVQSRTNAVTPCEGEHWDGQDTSGSSASPGFSAGCGTAADSDASDGAVGAAVCKNADINDGESGPATTGLPVALRLSAASGDRAMVYVGLDIFGVGRAVVHQDAGRDGTRTATYLRDNSDQIFGGSNVLATVVSTAGVTQGFAGEGDCNQEQYNHAATTGHRPSCTRDNTAVTVETILP